MKVTVYGKVTAHRVMNMILGAVLMEITPGINEKEVFTVCVAKDKAFPLGSNVRIDVSDEGLK